MNKPEIIIQCNEVLTVANRMSMAITYNEIRNKNSHKEIIVKSDDKIRCPFKVENTPFGAQVTFSKRELKFGFKSELSKLANAISI